ncbi:aminomethyl-transferring glycine dehydrogenase [Candidatus Nitronereus thalassa]|uniref:Glycine dehydrogenase (decarboxylating) n=1 Tax=Candidatus Nitronereus thalassa TaxID=3020898 RepID=A0ABU3K7T0_9BACT|nr:aminomethyl-transferring glycine dehydrogenase [Candidatus Nitronereus thalassa]MDT7042438.1 aminomethyl-transferring glycine dehydrogenase [Candidatus Nitronereus thalassa]
MSPQSEHRWFFEPETFPVRHIGSTDAEVQEMLEVLGLPSLDALVQATIPQDIRLQNPLNLPSQRTEQDVLGEMKTMAQQNTVYRSFIGMGYYDCVTPPVILRNILENPAWYTQYTPYQAELAQGRLEALLNFQTMVTDLTGLPLANASLLDEGTAAAEAMAMCFAIGKSSRPAFFASKGCHPQTLAVVQTRAESLGITLDIGMVDNIDWEQHAYCGLLLQYPTTDGFLRNYQDLAQRAHEAGTHVVVATDLLALTLLKPPGEFGADIAIGSSQRFGVPLGFGGPHAAFLSTKEEFARQMPGRIVGASKDAKGKTAYRLALQTREQHIRRDRATSNICTAQVLLANIAGLYAVYHGPNGLKRMAERVHGMTQVLVEGLTRLGCQVTDEMFFDTIRVSSVSLKPENILKQATHHGLNLRSFEDGSFGISLDEATTLDDLETLFKTFSKDGRIWFSPKELAEALTVSIPAPFARTTPFLTHEVFNRYHSEHELLRYMHRLQSRDLSLVHSMIPLGSCTMKLNATSEMIPVTWPEFSRIHPFAPQDQTAGYNQLFQQLESWLSEITGFSGVSLQPNAGSQGEYAGLMVIRAYQKHRGEAQRNICLIPVSAHGTNPASAVIAGLKVVPVSCDKQGNIDVADLQAKASQHREQLAALMVTYPSTHGVFEESIREVCKIVHEHGGQVYMDGANMNAMVGLCRPGDIGADVCHLNLHKTFCIPHGGGGPGMGPIAAASHLTPFLPGHPIRNPSGDQAIGAISAAPYGSPSILPISWAFIALMGGDGLTHSTKVAILNANYMAKRLEKDYRVLFRGKNGLSAHEFILDLRPFKKSADIEVEDVAKRLMDFGFHAPTISWPVAGTMMIEPTESESKAELDRYCEALITIRKEIEAIEEGRLPRDDNPLKNAPHTIDVVTSSQWVHPYTQEQAAFPAPWLRDYKFWPSVSRIDNAYGDRNLVCTCPPMEDIIKKPEA